MSRMWVVAALLAGLGGPGLTGGGTSPAAVSTLVANGSVTALPASVGIKLGTISGLPGIWMQNAIPSLSNFNVLFDNTTTILNTGGGGRVDLRLANSTYLSAVSGGACVSNGTASTCDGLLLTGPIKIGVSGTTIDDSYAASSTIDFAATTNTTSDSSAITVTGAAVGDTCQVGVPVAAQVAGAMFGCFVTAADTVKVRFMAVGTSIDPASGSFTVRVMDP